MRFVSVLSLFSILISPLVLSQDISDDIWYRQGDHWLKDKVSFLSAAETKRAAKNIILFVGDGMSITTLTASRIWQGQILF